VIELDPFVPRATTGPLRTSEVTVLDRLTSTEEQKIEAVEHMRQAASKVREVNGVAMRVEWSRGEPTILEVTFSVEHVEGRRVWLVDQVREFMVDGGQIPHDESGRYRRLRAEVEDMHERGML
jgi:hypothetical protein